MSGRSQANQMELASRIAQLEAELTQERRISHALREVSLAIGTAVDLDQILELILSKIKEVLDAERATLYLLDDTKKELVSRIVLDDSVETIRVRVGHGIAGIVAQDGQPIRVRDAYKDLRFLPDWDMITGYRTRSILAAPMKNHMGKIIGVAQALNKRNEGGFTEEDESLLTALAIQASVTIDNSRLYLSAIQKNMQLIETKEQLEHRVRDLKLLFDLESAMGRARSLDELLHAALSEAMQACEAQAGAVLVPDEFTGEPTAHVLKVDEPGGRLHRVIHPESGFLTSLITPPRTANVVDISNRNDDGPCLEPSLALNARSAVGVPLEEQDGTLFGALALYNKGPSAFCEEDGNLLRLIAANVSTALQLYRSQIAQERAERLTTIGRLLSSVIHDLKTPLAVISGYVQLMAAGDTNRPQRAEYAKVILRQFDSIQQMQREVLDFARGQKNLLIRRVYVQQFLHTFEQSLRLQLEGNPMHLSIETNYRGTARFDEGKLTRALHNLVRNALDAMGDKGGTLTLRVDREGSTIVFSVSDTGPGIPKEIQHRMFEAFATSGKKGGTGLGLAIVKKIIEEHGGSINMQTSVEGTTFRLLLPQHESLNLYRLSVNEPSIP